jgi:hypothetical protein
MAPDQSRGCILSSRTRGDTTEHHGPLQRLLDGTGGLRGRQTHLVPDPRDVLERIEDITAMVETNLRDSCE